MERIVVDTDILLDFILKRKPFDENAEAIFQAVYDKKVSGCIVANSILNAGYVASKFMDSKKVWDSLYKIMQVVDILKVDQEVLLSAIKSDFKDKEDAVIYIAALNAKVQKIVTRNVKDFKHSKIRVVSSL